PNGKPLECQTFYGIPIVEHGVIGTCQLASYFLSTQALDRSSWLFQGQNHPSIEPQPMIRHLEESKTSQRFC
ncbi:MAG: hypothetical protein ACPG4V_10095, partial [Limisphaerales bacterium]